MFPLVATAQAGYSLNGWAAGDNGYNFSGGFWSFPNMPPTPTTRYAAPSAVGSGDCSSWANACTLQTALSVAASGDEIWVKAGVHYPGSNRSDTFTLVDGVAVYGGFAGTEGSLTERDWQVNKTILSGDIDGNDIHGGDFVNESASQIVGNNAYHVVTDNGTYGAILDGFIITAGQADDNHLWEVNGGGMLNSGSPTLRRIVFSGNLATNMGGGMYNGGSPTLTDVIFRGNSAGSGGGVFNYSAELLLTNGVFIGNAASDRGGGMGNRQCGANVALMNVAFSGNDAGTQGGGMYNYLVTHPALTNVILWNNTAPTDAGISNVFGSSPVIAYSDIQGCGGSGAGWNSACGTDGGGNIEADPLFVDAAGGNLRLAFGSPAIETGANAGCPSTDLDGLPRPTDGNGDGTATCDMGAYEAGTMICGVSAGNDYTFSHQSGVNILVSMRGSLDCLYVDEMGLNHPQATTSLQTGRYWLIRGLKDDKVSNAGDYSASLTLPTTFTPDDNDKVCRYTGSGQVWDCAADSHTTNSITRDGVSAFSDWAVGNNVGPNAVTLHSVRVSSAAPWVVGMVGLLLAAIALRLTGFLHSILVYIKSGLV